MRFPFVFERVTVQPMPYFLLVLLLGTHSAIGGTKAFEALQKLQKSWDTIRTFQASFTQVVFAKRLGTRDESQGVVYILKPNKFRWESTSDDSFQIMNGNQLTSVQTNKRRGTRFVDVYHDISKVVDAKPMNFLAGKIKFAELYEAKLLSETEKLLELKLTPKGGAEETYIAEIDKGSYLFHALTTDSVDTRVRMEFSNIKTNLKLNGKLFEFKPTSQDVVNRQ